MGCPKTVRHSSFLSPFFGACGAVRWLSHAPYYLASLTPSAMACRCLQDLHNRKTPCAQAQEEASVECISSLVFGWHEMTARCSMQRAAGERDVLAAGEVAL